MVWTDSSNDCLISTSKALFAFSSLKITLQNHFVVVSTSWAYAPTKFSNAQELINSIFDAASSTS